MTTTTNVHAVEETKRVLTAADQAKTTPRASTALPAAAPATALSASADFPDIPEFLRRR